MNSFLIFLCIIVLILIYLNRNYIKYLWKEVICNDYDEIISEPDFCFSCNDDKCHKCKALKAWKAGWTEAAWRIFDENRKFD